VSPYPVLMENHWVPEPGADSERSQLMWFMCLGREPEAAALAALGQARLHGLPGLDLVPHEWLHMTTLIAGYTNEIPADQVEAMTAHARRLLAATDPVTITLSRVLYHPRAIMLAASPVEALQPVLAACREATRSETGRDGRLHRDPWIPHMTLAYGNSAQPAAPAIEALGRDLPADKVTVQSVSLISQTLRQKWTWELVAEVPLGTEPGSRPEQLLSATTSGYPRSGHSAIGLTTVP
jgi:2'-5' RNA ligase